METSNVSYNTGVCKKTPVGKQGPNIGDPLGSQKFRFSMAAILVQNWPLGLFKHLPHANWDLPDILGMTD